MLSGQKASNPQRASAFRAIELAGFTLSPDNAHVFYARWDRRQSNIMAIEY